MSKEKQTKAVTLYEYSVCPFCWKIKAMLSLKGIPFNAVEVHPFTKKEIRFSKEYRKVPILVDADGMQVNDSTEIMRHLEKLYPEPALFEKEPKKKEWEEKWLLWADKTLARSLPPLIYQTGKESRQAFDYITDSPQFSFLQKKFIKYAGAFVMHKIAKKSAKSQNILDPEAHFQNCLEQWAGALEEKKGEANPNAAEAAIYGVLKSIQPLPAFSLVKKLEPVHLWYQRITNARP